MAESKREKELPLTEHDDVTHWIGEMEKTDGKQSDTNRPTPKESPKRKG